MFLIHLYFILGSCSKCSKTEAKVVAFTGQSQSVSHTEDLKVVTFDVIRTNAGDGYDTTGSKFIAPRDGVYQFSMTAISEGSGDAVPLILYLNNQEITATSGGGPLGSGLVLVKLRQGDEVTLKVKAKESGGFFGKITGLLSSPSQVTFEGHLVRPLNVAGVTVKV